MNPEALRINLLQQLRAVDGATLPLGTLATGARLGGLEYATTDTVRAALVYLADKGLVVSHAPLVAPENKRWRITAGGTDFLAEAGL